MEGCSATTVQGATVTVRDLGSGAEVDSGVSDAYGELEFTLDEGILYELRGTTASGWNGTQAVYADGGGIRLLRLNPPTVPVTVSGNVPTVGGAISTVSVRCSPNQESAPVDPSGHFSVTVMGYPLTSCFIELESTAYDGTVSMFAEVSVLPDAPGSYAGTIDFTFPDVQTLRFVNPDGTPATTGILDVSTDESRQRPDETFETVQTSLHWDLADGPAQMLVGGGDFRFTLNAGNGYSLEDPSIISSEPGGMLFTIPTVRTLHISGTAPPGDPSDPTSIQVLCGPDDNRVEVAEDGRYELELLTIDTAQCTLTLEAHVNETQVSISRPVTFINGFGTADFSIPDDLDVTVTDAEGSAVTDAFMYMFSSGELPMPDGVIAAVVTDAQFGLDGSGPTTVSVVRAAEQGYQIRFDGGSRYSGTVNTLDETAVDIGLPPFARVEVTGEVHGWASGHGGSVRMTCGGDSVTASVDVEGNYAAVLDTFVPPTLQPLSRRGG